MGDKLSKTIMGILACPNCGNDLKFSENRIQCSYCQNEFEILDTGQPDFRLRGKKIVKIKYELGNKFMPDEDFIFDNLAKCNCPEIDFSKITIPWHLTRVKWTPLSRQFFIKPKRHFL